MILFTNLWKLIESRIIFVIRRIADHLHFENRDNEKQKA